MVFEVLSFLLIPLIFKIKILIPLLIFRKLLLLTEMKLKFIQATLILKLTFQLDPKVAT